MHKRFATITSATFVFVFLLVQSAYSNAAVSCDSVYQWSGNGKFLKGDPVRYRGLLFKAKRNATTEIPDPASTSGPWEYRGVCAAYRNVSVKCDFNGDGNMDLAKGLPDASLEGAIISGANEPFKRENKNLFNTGEILINYGNTSADTPPNSIWNQNGLGMFPYARTGANFGQVLSTGDFNKDHYCDLAIAAPYFSMTGVIGQLGKGLVNILYGSPDGLTISALGENGKPINPYDAQRFSQDTPGITGQAEEEDYFGYSLASGDFNGDGYDDLAVGVPGEDVVLVPQLGEVNSAGYFHIIYGSKSGLQTTAPASVGYFQHLAGVPLFEVEAGDFYAGAMAAADFDHDGYADLVIAAPRENVNDYDQVGKVSLIRGSATGLDINSRRDISLFDVRPDLVSTYSQFGYKLRVVDSNGDGFQDLEIDFYNHFAVVVDEARAKIQIKGSASGLIINGQ